MQLEVPRRVVIGVSLKMYMGLAQTKSWMDALAGVAADALPDGVDLFVIPSFLSLRDSRDSLAGTPVMLGAQDVFWEDAGAFTGEISPTMLVEAGCRMVEIGHAERRRLFGETDEVVGRKTAAAIRAGLVPVLCIGEEARMEPAQAVDACMRQFRAATEGTDPAAPLLVAWEPVWAIGAAEPASPDFIRAVGAGLRAALGDRAATRLIYGGSAGPGLLRQLDGAVDGLFLGRFAHDIDNLRRVLAEAGECVSPFSHAG
ncbi:triose-phosphate isomerase [Acetobacteraceae bacterium KSS8]|uniref:Triosephosphate isomerase n=1 Tax=Endosaccharibacter trunci TaxID=2812733 RepID=A0ABT1W6L8_9PROT|nr:triose-phosphate isomerase [Acetobacteraceae bacterium KSS8]